MITLKSGVSIATTAALLAIAATSAATPAFAKSAKVETVHCYGVNSCKGTSDCKTASNDCKGQNNCKGHGFKEMSAKACATAGGSLTEIK